MVLQVLAMSTKALVTASFKSSLEAILLMDFKSVIDVLRTLNPPSASDAFLLPPLRSVDKVRAVA
eukprot:2269491-Amphidinium_carterae.1